MNRAHKMVVVVVVLWVAAAAYGQSLGDVAREQRQKQANTSHVPHKVVTNEEIPEHEEVVSCSSKSSGERDSTESASASNDMHAGEQWKARIQAQKNSVASLQNQIDKLNSSIHFVEANRYYNGVQYNERQVQKQNEVQRMQKQLDEQKKQLEDMQESARKAGLGSSVYEP